MKNRNVEFRKYHYLIDELRVHYKDTLNAFRVHWDYITNRYVFQYYVNRTLFHEFIIDRTSKHCYKVCFSATKNLFEVTFVSFKKASLVADWIHYTHKFYKKVQMKNLNNS